MPVQRGGKSPFLAKMGKALVEAHEAHKGDETEYSAFGELPPMDGGIAQLVDCKFTQIKEGKNNAGEYMFYAAGTVVSPSEVKTENGTVRVKGLRTQISEPLFETPGRSRETVQEHVAWVYNELRKLGVDTNGLEVDDLEATLDALKEAKPHFRFRTWQGEPSEQYPNPRVNHVWNGAVDYNEVEGETGIEDNTGDEDDKTEDAPADEAEAIQELDSLALLADSDEDSDEKNEAIDKLEKLALEVGITQKEIDKADNWNAVLEMINEKQAESAGDEAQAEDDDGVKVGRVYKFKPDGKDPKTKKPYRSMEVEVTAVNDKKETADLKSLDNPKVTFKGIAWDRLEE